MYKIINKEILSKNIFAMDIESELIARSAKPGQFIILIVDDKGERIPLTICDTDLEKSTVKIVVQIVGYSTKKLSLLEEGDYISDFVGPLGSPSSFVYKDKKVLESRRYIFIGGGLGIAPLYPQIKWLRNNIKNISIDVILGARNKELIVLEEEIKSLSDNLYITTDDGSRGEKGLVTDKLKRLIDQGNEYDRCICIGPTIMMKYISSMTKEFNIKTYVSMNPLMVDGTGMCGACRVSLGDKTKFACIDGPEFDGHKIDFDEAIFRLKQYKEEEECACKKGDINNG